MNPLIAIIMGSQSDWPTMKLAASCFETFEIAFEKKIISAHRTPDLMCEFAKNAQARGIKIIIAGAGGAAHLPGMVASLTTLPVLGVPIKSQTLNGVDSMLSIVQMPKGVPVATFAIGDAGAYNAALFALALLATSDHVLAERLQKFRAEQENRVLNQELPR